MESIFEDRSTLILIDNDSGVVNGNPVIRTWLRLQRRKEEEEFICNDEYNNDDIGWFKISTSLWSVSTTETEPLTTNKNACQKNPSPMT
jgi:hypothetical protein